MPALRPAWQAGPMRNPREGTSVVLHDTIRLTWWSVYCVVVARPLLIERCVGLREGSGVERPCAMIFTTVSLATNSYCIINGHSSNAPCTVGPRVQFSGAREQSHDDWPGIQQEAICYQCFKQRLILSVSKSSISQRSQIKEDTIEPYVPAREFNLKAYASTTSHNDQTSLGLEPRLADHRSQAARTVTLPTVPPRQATL